MKRIMKVLFIHGVMAGIESMALYDGTMALQVLAVMLPGRQRGM